MPTADVSPTTTRAEEPSDELIVGEAVALSVRPASMVLRGAGAAIDFLVYIGGFLLLLWGVLTVADGADEALTQALVIASLVLAIVVAPTLVEVFTAGRSLGKWAIGARIVRDDGGGIRLRHAFIRALVGVFEIYMTFGGVAALTGLLNSRAKRLGDLLAGTYSQHERVPAFPTVTFGVPAELAVWAQTADVARMPDHLARRVAAFLAQAGRLTPATRTKLAASLAEETRPYVSPLPAVSPELFLAGVSVVRRERESAALSLERRRLDALTPALRGLPHGFPRR